MALSRPALDILGISPGFTRAHPQAVVVAAADGIYRAAAKSYHPDRGVDALPLPSGVNLTELQEARDAVRSNPGACIKEIGQGERTSKEEKRSEELAARVSILEKSDDAWADDITTLWDYIARSKLGLKIEEEMVDNRAVAYSTLHLNGVAILVVVDEVGKSVFYEYLRHKDTWFKRPVVRAHFSKKNPCAPNVPPELIAESISAGKEQGTFYDQSGPHVLLEGFEVLGSYRKADLVNARAERRKAGKKKHVGDAPPALSPFKVDPSGHLDPVVATVLKPSVSVGAILQSAIRGDDGFLRYVKSGTIMGVRVFDQNQRPQ